jgi:pantoate--beta-alanine ligase
MSLAIVRTVKDLRAAVRDWRRQGFSVGLVPTMGALHEGHMSLVRAALARADRVIATIFVNPKQFNNAADLANYPRTDVRDAAMLEAAGAHLLFMPDGAQMYPEGFATTVSVAGVSEGLCGTFRPGHFEGVATVVAKLFLQSGADLAFFGEKDFQQLRVIERMACDLDIPIEVVPCKTVREADGLALSSRNARLTAEQRALAACLPEALFAVAADLTAGRPLDDALRQGRDRILAGGFRNVEYLELRSAADLKPMTQLDRPARLLVAAWIGEIRLIDNVAVTPTV